MTFGSELLKRNHYHLVSVAVSSIITQSWLWGSLISVIKSTYFHAIKRKSWKQLGSLLLMWYSVAPRFNHSQNIWDKLYFSCEIAHCVFQFLFFRRFLQVLKKVSFREEWGLGNNSIKFWNLPDFFLFPKVLSLKVACVVKIKLLFYRLILL